MRFTTPFLKVVRLQEHVLNKALLPSLQPRDRWTTDGHEKKRWTGDDRMNDRQVDR